MIMKAIQKINTEMQKNPTDTYTEIVGHYIIDRCGDEITAAKVADEKKSLKGAMDAVMQLATKKKQGNVAVLTPQDVFGAVDQYFDMATDEAAQEAAIMGAGGAPKPQVEPPAAKKVVLNLSDFL